MAVRAWLAYAPDNPDDMLYQSIIVVTMTGEDLAKIRASLSVLTEMGGADIRNDLMPLLSALELT